MSEEGLNEKLQNLSVSEAPDADAEDQDLPEDIRKLIQSTVEGDDDSDKPEGARKEITGDDLLNFFTRATQWLLREKSINEVRALASDFEEDMMLSQARMDKIKQEVDNQYTEIWRFMGVDDVLGKHAMIGIEKTLMNENIDADYRKDLQSKVIKFTQTEQEFVARALMGDEMYKKRAAEKKRVEEVKEQLEAELAPMEKEERGKRVMELKSQAIELRTKLMSMGQENAAKYLSSMSEEEAKTMDTLAALALMIQEKSEYVGINHGHSHNGQPCHGHGGHGHSHEQPQHGHSHNGQPCHGHGHQNVQPQAAHGHSHDGKPCHGHGHSH